MSYPVDFEYKGLQIRQYSEMCYQVTTNPKGQERLDSEVYPEASITQMITGGWEVEFYGEFAPDELELMSEVCLYLMRRKMQ